MIVTIPKVKSTLSDILEKRNPDAVLDIKPNDKQLKLVGDYSVGIELELERLYGNMDKNKIDYTMWEEHREGSLRGGDATELVTRFPIKGEALLSALYNVYEAAKDSMAPMKSLRTSTHIHVNALDLSVEELCFLLLVSVIAEPYLYSVNDPYRRYCGFCLPSMKPIAQVIANFLHNKSLRVNEQSRYYGINVLAIHKYGTVEFRHFSTPDKVENAVDMVNICLELKNLAIRLANDNPKLLTKNNLEQALDVIKTAVQNTFKTKLTLDTKELELAIVASNLFGESWKRVDTSDKKEDQVFVQEIENNVLEPSPEWLNPRWLEANNPIRPAPRTAQQQREFNDRIQLEVERLTQMRRQRQAGLATGTVNAIVDRQATGNTRFATFRDTPALAVNPEVVPQMAIRDMEGNTRANLSMPLTNTTQWQRFERAVDDFADSAAPSTDNGVSF